MYVPPSLPAAGWSLFLTPRSELDNNCVVLLSNTFSQSASGISFKSQFLYLLVYVTRYIDLLWTFYNPSNLYNTIFKIVFISSSAYVVYLMLNDYKPTHDPNLDTFKVQYLLGASGVLAILFPYHYTFYEVSKFLFCSRRILRESRSSFLSPDMALTRCFLR